jgi:hypothetical protein
MKDAFDGIITSELVLLLTLAMITIERDFPVTKIINTEVRIEQEIFKNLGR